MNQSLSATITRLRKERGLTQEQLGQLVGVSAQAVSKWEKCGAPDVELLPVLADRLGVSMDALFGRADPSTADMTTQFQQWLLSIPLEQRFSALFELLAATSTCLGSNLMNSGFFPSMTLGSTCYVDNIVPNATSRTWLRAYVKSEEGLLLGVLAKDFPLYLLMPEPPDGYRNNLPSPEECRKLFSALALPGAMEILLFLYRREEGFYHPSAIAKHTGLPLDDVLSALPQMAECELLKKKDLELEDGPTQVYTLHDNYAFVPFLFFARWLTQPEDAHVFACDIRKRPILAPPPEKKENQS